MSRILCSGAAGFLASHLCDHLAAAGHTVLPVDNLLGGEWANIENTELRMNAWHADCSDFNQMEECCERFKPEVVFHCAAAPHEGLSVFSPAFITKHTYMTTVSLASAAVAHGCRRFVNLSSMSRFGVGSFNKLILGPPFTEDMDAAPVDPYGIAKVAGEQVVRCLSQVHGMEFVNVCPHNAYGSRQRYHDPFRNVPSIFANLMLQGQSPFIYGDGSQVRCFSHWKDVIEPIAKCGFQGGLNGETINIGPDAGFVTINTLAMMISQIVGFKGHFKYLPDRPREVKIAYCSADKARDLLGYEAKVDLHEGLEELVASIKRKGPRPFQYHLPLEIMSDKMPKTWSEKLM